MSFPPLIKDAAMANSINRKSNPKNARHGRILLFAMVLLLSGCLFSEDRVARGSVVENEITGVLLTSGGSPSVGARVNLYSADSRPGAEKGALSETFTDAMGTFHFSGVQNGVYSLIGQHDTLLAFHDSIKLAFAMDAPKKVLNLVPDTLRATGAITVQITLKPGDDPSTVSGIVLGTGFGALAQSNGDLSMTGMPAGRLRIRFTSSIPGYLPLEVAVDVAPGKTSAAGALPLPY
jgi:hypothetical protein